MNRREILGVLAGGLLTTGSGFKAHAALAGESGDAALAELFETLFVELVAERPEYAMALGGDASAFASRLSDYSLQGRENRATARSRQLALLQAVPREGLSPQGLRQLDMAIYTIEAQARMTADFAYGDGDFFPYAVTPFSAAYLIVPGVLASLQPLGTADGVEAYMDRLAAFPAALDDETERLRREADAGVSAPDFVLDGVLAGLAQARRDTTLEAQLVAPLRRSSTAPEGADRVAAAQALIAQGVGPALERQIETVRRLRETASSEAGVWRLPQGEAYYAGALARATTTDLSPAEAHRIGLAQVEELTASLDLLLRSQGLSVGSVGERLDGLRAQASQTYANDDAGRREILADLNGYIQAAQARLPQAFDRLPQKTVTARRAPPAAEAAGGAFYSAAAREAQDASFYIGLADTAAWPRYSLRTLCHHEAVPGHHLQGSLAADAGAAPRLFSLFKYPGYSEGWALYAEALSQELGLFEADPLGEIGMRQSLLFRAARVVVDTGLHHGRWTRERAIQYLVATTGMPPERLSGDVTRYCIAPGQACSYSLGFSEWRRAREEAQARLGANFDLRRFHDILQLGAMPLALMRAEASRRSA